MYVVYALRCPGHPGSRRLLRHALAQSGLSPDLEPVRLPGGKPVLSDFHFSLSHSGAWAVCAVSDRPVGVDLELERSYRPSVERKLTPREREQLSMLDPQVRRSGFFDLWVLKEAALKQTGEGLSGLSRVEVSLSPAAVSIPGLHAALLPFPEAGYHLALCGSAPIPARLPVAVLPEER